MSFIEGAFFDYALGRARLESGRFISNKQARGLGLLEDMEDEKLSRLETAAATIASDYGGDEIEARLRIAAWWADREDGVPDEENPFPSP